MTARSTRGDDSTAESLFADFLARAKPGAEPDLEALCKRWPAHATRFRALQREREQWRGVEDLPGGAAPDGDGASSTSSRGSTGAAARQIAELLEQLEAHRPKKSRYAVRGIIARGGMGAIHELHDQDLRRDLAMKTLRKVEEAPGIPAREPSAQELHRFVEEAQITAQLSHPGVVPVHELGLDEHGRVFFTMSRVQGHDLRHVFQLVRDGAEGWSPTRALGVLLKVCETMAYAHQKGVIHRDLKPANVMVGSFGEVYVMDWGLAKLAGKPDEHDLRPDPSVQRVVSTTRRDLTSKDPSSSLVTMDGTIVGTPSFMSPEQAQGKELDARSDVYALGAMLYTLLAGRNPYVAPGAAVTPGEIWQAIKDGAPEKLSVVAPNASPELVAICEKAMQREPSARYPDTNALAEDLRSYLEGHVVRAYQRGAWAEFKKWVGRNKGTAGALAGLLVAIVAGAVVAVWSAATVADKNTRILGLADQKKFDDLVAKEATLWPALPANADALKTWVANAEALQANVSTHQESRKLLSSSSGGDEDAWLEQKFGILLDELEHKLPELMPKVAARRDLALSIEERTVTGADARKRWDEAIRDIATLPKYHGLKLTPQIGLLPLGRNDESGLWEFHHVLSGDEPQKVRGRWIVTETSGLVLVLLPGATTSMGSLTGDENRGKPYYDGLRDSEQRDEDLIEGVELRPFFASKYETTQAQWARFFGSNPSKYPGIKHSDAGLHPVEQVSLTECRELALRLALEVPTEAQWEFACRAGTSTPFSSGDQLESLHGRANVADAAFVRSGSSNGGFVSEEVDDGAVIHALVGSYEPNAFGIHDAHGNVWEWSNDDYDDRTKPRAGDGARRAAPNGGEGVIRGGSWFAWAFDARSANRRNWNSSSPDQDIGVRFVRRLDP